MESWGVEYIDGKPVFETIYNVTIGSIFKIGKKIDEDILLQANNGDANLPTIKYNSATNKWQYSNDGVTFYDMIASTILSGYLKLDQTTPQTVINGAPQFNNGIKIRSGYKVIYDGA